MNNYQLSMNQLTNWPINQFLQDKRQSRASQQQATSNQQPATKQVEVKAEVKVEA
jgi:hypothetical protein